jgi:hypothetical protein
MAIEPTEISFQNTDALITYKKVLGFLSQIGEIEDKQEGIYIIVKTGDLLKIRAKGIGIAKVEEIPTKVRVDFINRIIRVEDRTGPGIKFGVSGKIKRRLDSLADEIRQVIDVF